jgi:hypothetical protein
MIKIEDYIFLRMIGYPYSGRVNGDDIIIQEKSYFENYSNDSIIYEPYLQSSSHIITSNNHKITKDDDTNNLLYQIKEYSSNLYEYICDKYQIVSDGFVNFSDECKSEIFEWYSLVKVAGNMTKDWFLGEGYETRRFSNDKVALCMKNSKSVDRIRKDFYAKAKRVGYIKGLTYTSGRGTFGLTGLLNAGLDPIEQFVGSCRIDITCSDGKNLHFVVWNKTSFNSFLYHIGSGINSILEKVDLPKMPEWEWNRDTFKYMGNMEQFYEWDEPIDFQYYK